MKKRSLTFSAVCLTAVACSGASDDVAPVTAVGAEQSAVFSDPDKTMVFVAHQDDDIGITTPDSLHTIQEGKAFRAVVFTSGDAGFPCADETGYIKGRETGELAAWAKMAGVPFNPADPDAAWSDPGPQPFPTLPGKFYRIRTLIANPKVSLVYLAIPNDDQKVLENLWNGTGSPSYNTYEPDNRRPQNSYTRAELLKAVLWLMTDFQPAHISTLDSSKFWATDYPFDHTDHLHAALFAHSASLNYTTPHTFRTYRTYNPQITEPENVSTADQASKLEALTFYGEWDKWFPNAGNNHCPSGTVTICGKTDICQDPDVFWGGLMSRQYTIAPTHGNGSVGGIAGPSGKCLQAAGTSAGNAIALATCNMGNANQNFSIKADGTIRLKSNNNLCIAANGASALPRPRGIGLTLRACAPTPISEQQFMVMSNGQLRAVDATCVQANGSALAIQECASGGAASQSNFRLQASPAPFTGVATGYSDTEIPDSARYYRSFSMGDIDNDKDADICVRRSGGIYCSKSNGAGIFTAPPAAPTLAAFTNAQGWGVDEYGSTVQLADITGDGRADVCGRGPGGIHCATWSPTGVLGSFSPRSTAFSTGWSGTGYFDSIRFPDVDGDGRADVCGRGTNGIECALNNGSGTFANTTTSWLSTEFTNNLLWNNESSGSTIQYGDIDGDGKIDVCGRATDGIRCAQHDKASQKFVNPKLWGASDDFDDVGLWFVGRSYYWSIQLADINGDGRADVCGRGGGGLRCGISMGSSFALSQFMIPVNPYNDGGFFDTSWEEDRYGSTLRFGDLNGDKHADVCARGPSTPGAPVVLRCTFSP